MKLNIYIQLKARMESTSNINSNLMQREEAADGMDFGQQDEQKEEQYEELKVVSVDDADDVMSEKDKPYFVDPADMSKVFKEAELQA